ncbi:MAG: DMT family transporter [Kordiimonadaceae bacterium]|nr:DMT family transporter [Kordiimonadaceae bacterium]MBO6569775.1 DMT family transporter [Kordiimonadaceae bacterium]MBO6966310.1 DMT family transporter [Kordiimonadaceae bacterium]
MQVSQLGFFALMLAAGVGIPIMAALNSGLGQKLGNPLAAVFVLCVVATIAVTILLVATGIPSLGAVSAPSPAQLSAGGLFIFYIASITYAAPKIGLGNAVFFVLLGQLVCAAVIDHFSLLGAANSPITGKRMVGLALMAVGVYLAKSEVLPAHG